MLRVEDLHTYYGQGHVLQGVDLEVPAGPHRGRARPQRRRQDHDVTLDHGPHAAAARPRAA